jgi:hypothetical protein
MAMTGIFFFGEKSLAPGGQMEDQGLRGGMRTSPFVFAVLLAFLLVLPIPVDQFILFLELNRQKLPCSLGLIWLAESTAGWFFMRENHC